MKLIEETNFLFPNSRVQGLHDGSYVKRVCGETNFVSFWHDTLAREIVNAIKDIWHKVDISNPFK